MEKVKSFFAHKATKKYIGIVVFFLVADIFLNLVRHQPIWHNMDNIFYLVGLSLFAYLLSLLKVRLGYLYSVAFVCSFIFLTVQMLIDGSYVDYTSLVLGGICSLLLAFAVTYAALKIQEAKEASLQK